MDRRNFCKSTIAAAVAAASAGCDRRSNGSGQLAATAADGSEIALDGRDVADLAAQLDGRLFRPADEGYEAAKLVWNGMFADRQPAIVAQCASADDVSRAVRFAADQGVLLTVKGGGHSFPGKSTSDGGLMIDLSQMNGVAVDAGQQRMRAGGGALLGQLDDAATAENLLTTTGIVSHTGAGGFTLGGGMGRTDRAMGLAIDNLIAATVVTASGEIVTASADEHPDLYWGIRGGGGNFGVVTEFHYRLHPFNPVVYGGDLFYPIDRDFLDFYAELAMTLPDEANIEPQLMRDPDGNPVVFAEVVWCGDHAAGEKALAPLLEYPGLKDGSLGPFPYRDIQTRIDGMTAHGNQYYLKSGYLLELTEDARDVIVEFANRPGPATSWFQHLGGATARVAQDATAYAHRDAAFNFGIMYGSDDPSGNDAGIAAVRDFHAAMEPHMHGFYVNLHDDSSEKTRSNFGPNLPRLIDVKRTYDPDNLFRYNANIDPRA